MREGETILSVYQHDDELKFTDLIKKIIKFKSMRIVPNLLMNISPNRGFVVVSIQTHRIFGEYLKVVKVLFLIRRFIFSLKS